MDARIDRDWARAERFFAQGNLAAARAVCESLLARAPTLPSAHWMLSRIHLASGRFRASVDHARVAARSADSLPVGMALVLTRQLLNVGEYEPALRSLRSMSGRMPIRDAEATTEFADQLSLLEDQDGALAAILRAGRSGVNTPELHYLRGNALKFLGRLPEAAAAYEDAISSDPGHAHAHWSLAHVATGADADRRIARIRRLLGRSLSNDGQSRQALLDRSVLGYGLFRELDVLGDIAGAWQALDDAMRLRRKFVDHDADEETRLFDQVIETFSRDFVSQNDGFSAADSVPIFIVGMPRSGTTLLERILGSHPDVTACGELNDFRMQVKWSTDHYSRGFLDRETTRRLHGVDFAQLGKGYLDRTIERTRSKRWFSDKSPGNFILSAVILRALPQARVIHIHRDPMDACFSNLKELFSPQFYTYSYSFAEVATHANNHARLMRHLHAVAPGKVLDLAYEDLVAEPQAQSRRIMEFCGLVVHPGLHRVEDNQSPVTTASSVQVREAIHHRGIASWRRFEAQLAPLQCLIDQRPPTGQAADHC